MLYELIRNCDGSGLSHPSNNVTRKVITDILRDGFTVTESTALDTNHREGTDKHRSTSRGTSYVVLKGSNLPWVAELGLEQYLSNGQQTGAAAQLCVRSESIARHRGGVVIRYNQFHAQINHTLQLPRLSIARFLWFVNQRIETDERLDSDGESEVTDAIIHSEVDHDKTRSLFDKKRDEITGYKNRTTYWNREYQNPTQPGQFQ